MSDLRVIFMGTAELACASLEALFLQPQFSITAVITQPDRPKGRELKFQPSPVKQFAARIGLNILQPERARNENFIQHLRELRPDLIVVAAYGQILPLAILEIPKFGCLNVHTSLLPKFRGAAPIQWAILTGESETGVTIMKMDAGLDTGDILTQQATPIQCDDNSQTLHDRLARMGAELLVATIREHITGKLKPRPQPAEGFTYARKITREDGHLDWSQPARVLWNRIRAFTSWPGAFTYLPAQPQPVLLKIWQAQVAEDSGTAGQILHANKSGILVGCGEQSLLITNLQREGGRRLIAREFLAGHHLEPGQKFANRDSAL